MKKRLLLERKNYNPLEFEEKIYKYWLPYFRAKKSKKNFIILIAPPNITGSLHMGHTFQNFILDTLARYKRMAGFHIVWIPGTDHAGIATQNVVEKELRKEGVTRFELGREKFIARVWQWKDKYGQTILNQFRRLGLSLDWSRSRFTLDKEYTKTVQKAFVDYYRKGLVYRALRPVNFCPRCQTSLSDLEIEYREAKGNLYYIKYPLKGSGFVIVATTRPETMLGDVALAVNPHDETKSELVGKIAILPLVMRELPIVTDQRVDPKFGAGILKVTPAHSLIDYEISLRHDLPMVGVIDEKGKMNHNAVQFKGLDYLEARRQIVDYLDKQNLIEKIEEISHQIPLCERCGTEIQVIPSDEWFIKMDYLANLAYKLVKDRKVDIYPAKFRKPYFDWLRNVRDWCVSRKLWWGQQMPVWYCKHCHTQSFQVSINRPKRKCSLCKGTEWQMTEEVFDTWFSSALWPFAILYKKNEKEWYPADIVASAREILHLWITRMIFSGQFFLKKPPFKRAFIHSTILTKDGKRMSKSLGTGVDPLELISKYGSDSVRFGLLWQMTTHQDIRFDEQPIEQGKKFLNKIWNAYRFYFMKLEEKDINFKNKNLSSADKKILSALRSTRKFCQRKIEELELGLALKRIYKFFWNDLCDIYLESWKGESKNNPMVFKEVMIETLKMLHPWLPHLTQLIYFALGHKKPLFFERWK
ncbi:MAG: valine--tRNA ligase [Patescibacteria group bacterium]|nr:valine--tRNA ligase [Patescibacteria group bacterium]